MLALTLVILPVTVFSIGAVKLGSSQQKSLPHIPRAGNHTSLHATYLYFLFVYIICCLLTLTALLLY